MYYNRIYKEVTGMGTTITFHMDADLKAEMAAICSELGMTPSAAFNLFATAFVRAKGMPFPVAVEKPANTVTREKMPADTEALLREFSGDYRRMAE